MKKLIILLCILFAGCIDRPYDESHWAEESEEITEPEEDTYEEEDTQVIERHLNSWQNIGFIPDLQWYGATAEFMVTFTNVR